MLNALNIKEAKKTIKRHYNISRQLSDDEVIAEIRALDGRSRHYIYDDRQIALANALEHLGVISLTYKL